MTEGDVLLRDIIANPADDDLRLIYADWCADHGQPERAEFIRVQIRIASLGGMPACARCGTTPGWHKYTPRCRGEACRLRQREYYSGRRHTAWGWRDGVPQTMAVGYRRGFVGEIRRCSLALWMGRGPVIMGAHPLEEIECREVLVTGDRNGGGPTSLYFVRHDDPFWRVTFHGTKNGLDFHERHCYDKRLGELADILREIVTGQLVRPSETLFQRAKGWFSRACLAWARKAASGNVATGGQP